MKIGIIREGKRPPDKRVPFTPEHCRQIMDSFRNLEIVVQPSPFRCFSDKEYMQAGITIQEELSDCDVLMGIKEVPVDDLIPGKIYFFFSHTVKKQPYNRELLREIVKRNIQLIDYELLKEPTGQRIIGFGRFAGLVGAYNGLRAYGIRHGLFRLKPAWHCDSLAEMKAELSGIRLPGIRITVTGEGRVSSGVMELFGELGIQRTSPDEFLRMEETQEAVMVQLNPLDYNRHKSGNLFTLDHFFAYPEEYETHFGRFLPKTDLFISAAYWDPKAPVLFSPGDTIKPEFRISVIADITCDIGGSVPTTTRASSIEDPFYDFNPETNDTEIPFTGRKNITVMAVDNLPCELPRDSSLDFGTTMIEKVLPLLTGEDPGRIIDRATITRGGKLTEKFSYLQEFMEEKE